jgi:hypothetical protein
MTNNILERTVGGRLPQEIIDQFHTTDDIRQWLESIDEQVRYIPTTAATVATYSGYRVCLAGSVRRAGNPKLTAAADSVFEAAKPAVAVGLFHVVGYVLMAVLAVAGALLSGVLNYVFALLGGQ